MSRDAAIRDALDKAAIRASVQSAEPLSGGCIHEILRLSLSDGSMVVAKLSSAADAALFEEESRGLQAIARTNTVRVPSPIVVNTSHQRSVLLMEYLEPANAAREDWERFGDELASLHQIDVGTSYGFDFDNHLGTTPQPNARCDDWVEFNAVHRLGHQVRLARSRHLLTQQEIADIERVIDRLDRLIPRTPKAALLHGDLWSGNALAVKDDGGASRIAVIDPAPYIGDGLADIAMMQLFGGFPAECYKAYRAKNPDKENVEQRMRVYQLYHVLNHVNIFGRSYAGQAMSIAKSLL